MEMRLMKQVTAAVIGAGNRGTAYASYALRYPSELRIVAVAEPSPVRREKMGECHGIPSNMLFENWEELMAHPRLAEAVLICTQDRMHYQPAIMALKKGYHVLLEKPMATDPAECLKMGACAEDYQRIFLICHVLRYTSFFSTLKKLLDEGKIGRLISIQHNENLAYWHQAHSYVRGNWRNSTESSPMILAKSCHDMDIMLWLAGADCQQVSSFGSLTHFKQENAPMGAPARCLDGCPAEKDCLYYAPRIYLTERTDWPVSAITNDLSLAGRVEALKTGPYGRCVYFCDNNVVDHQVVNLQFANEVTAAFTMCAFSAEESRTIKLMGTEGEIRGHMKKNEIEVVYFGTGRKDLIRLEKAGSGHGGGDDGLMRHFIREIQGEAEAKTGLTSAGISVQSHLMALAAERSRLEKRVITISDYVTEVMRGWNSAD